MASTSRMLARNLLPRPSPLLAPSTSPPMSTTCTAAWIDVAAARHLGQPVESLVGHLGDADVRVLGGERIRRGERAAACQGVVQRALAGVGEADQAEAFHAADDATGALATVPEVRWGLSLSLSEELADPRVVAEVAITAERAGWDGIFVWDHLWNRTYEPFADAWVTLSAVATATQRVHIGTMVLALPRRRCSSSPRRRRASTGCRVAVSCSARARGGQLRRVLPVRRAGLRRQGARRARSTPASDCSCRCSRAVRCRSSTGAGRRRPGRSDRARRSGSPGSRITRPGRDASLATGWRASRSLARSDWSPETVTRRWQLAGSHRVRSTSPSSVAPPRCGRARGRRRDVVHPRDHPGATAADALSRAGSTRR